jgi:hypothetical protein
MPKERCKCCKQELDLEEGDRIKICAGEEHITVMQYERKLKRDKEKK